MNLERGVIGGQAVELETDAPARPRKRRAIVIGAVLIAVVVVGLFLFGGRKAPPPAAPVLPRITFVVPGRQAVTASVSAVGSIAARREMPVGVAGEGGLVTRVLVDAGQWVGKNQVLATIDRSVQVEQSAQMRAQIASAEAEARMAENELKRAESLVSNGFVSRSTLDQKRAARDSAIARIRLARAQTGEMNARLARLDIRAPEAGLVLMRNVEPGQIVSGGTGMLFRIAKGGELEMQARLGEDDLARLRVGSPAQVTPVGSPQAFNGRIWQLSPVVDPMTRQGTARILLPYDPALRPGGFANAQIGGASDVAPLLPESAVLSDAQGNYVMLVGKDDKIERRNVTVGEVDDRGVTVTKGLTGTERVVESAGAFLNVGDKVQPVRAPAPKR